MTFVPNLKQVTCITVTSKTTACKASHIIRHLFGFELENSWMGIYQVKSMDGEQVYVYFNNIEKGLATQAF